MVLKFDLLNASDVRMGAIVLRVVVRERTTDADGSVDGRLVAGPFMIRGTHAIEPGFTFEYELLLKNLRSDCECTAEVTVLSAQPVTSDSSRSGVVEIDR
jgi:hypothetical protein